MKTDTKKTTAEIVTSELNELTIRHNVLQQLDAEMFAKRYLATLAEQDIQSYIKTLATKYGLDESLTYIVDGGKLVPSPEQKANSPEAIEDEPSSAASDK